MPRYLGPAPIFEFPDFLDFATADPNQAGAPWAQGMDHAILSRSTVSLALIAKVHGGLWLPDYFCNSSLALCRAWNLPLRFYPVLPDMTPDWDWCRLHAFTQKPQAFVLAHYFGRAIDTLPGRAMADQAGWALVEDAAHLLCPAANIGQTGDYVLYSPHKMLPLPLGAVLATRRAGPVLAAAKRLPAVASGRAEIVWAAKRLLQKSTSWAPIWTRRLQGTDHADDPAEGSTVVPAGLSRWNLRWMAAQQKRLPQLLKRRQEQTAACIEILDDHPRLQILKDQAAPYRVVLQAADAHAAQDLFQSFRRFGVAAESWPDLPPEIMANTNRHATALDLRRRMILLPLPSDQKPCALARRYGEAVVKG